jgi:WD40 repeat protein
MTGTPKTILRFRVQVMMPSRLLPALAVATIACTLAARAQTFQGGPADAAQRPPAIGGSKEPTSIEANQELRLDLQGDPLPAGAIARLGTLRLRYGNRIRSLAFTPDGKGLVSGSGMGDARLWDVATGKVLKTLVGGQTQPMDRAAISPDGAGSHRRLG